MNARTRPAGPRAIVLGLVFLVIIAGSKAQARSPAGGSGVADMGPVTPLLSLAARHGVSTEAADVHRLGTIDRMPRPAQAALTRFVLAFSAFEAAANRAYTGPGAPAGVDLERVLQARATLLTAATGLQTELSVPLAGGATAVDLCPAFALDLVGGTDTYTADCALIIDIGGDDTYLNNAGGSDLGAAALLDLAGNDAYVSGRSFGVNGGGNTGAGFLVDAQGDDEYRAGSHGGNGGAYFFGSGFLLDAGGNDSYTATTTGANGGGASLGLGRLVDVGGTDVYSDQDGGSGTDRTVAPKGSGAQIDSTNPVPSNPPSPPPVPPLPTFGSIEGKVTDARTKAGIPAAAVDCVIGRAGPTVTGPDGSYFLPLVPAATHTCTARAVGYSARSQQVTVTAGQTATASFALRKA